jgi:serine phosphatase RsbU (regulator of sigma subunit)
VEFPSDQILLAVPTDIYVFSDGMFDMQRREGARALDSLVEFLLEPSATDGRSVEEVRLRAMELLDGRPLPDDCSILKLSLV